LGDAVRRFLRTCLDIICAALLPLALGLGLLAALFFPIVVSKELMLRLFVSHRE
jgi:hypothetical protein